MQIATCLVQDAPKHQKDQTSTRAYGFWFRFLGLGFRVNGRTWLRGAGEGGKRTAPRESSALQGRDHFRVSEKTCFGFGI